MLKRIFLILCLLCPLTAYAALDLNGVSMTASVNKTTLTMEDELVLTVTVEGVATDISPQLPSLPAFNVYARSVVKQINDFKAVTSFEYIMMPRFPGKATIGPVTLSYGNKIYKTDPIEVSIYRVGSAPKTASAPAKPAAQAKQPARTVQQAPANLPPMERDLYNLAAQNGDKDFFMVAAADNRTPYVNQTATLAVRFYYSAPFLDNAPYSSPSISNLFMEEISSSEGRQTIDGKAYLYMEKRYAVSGVTPGKAEAGAASVRYIPASRINLSVFDRMFAAVGQEEKTVRSNPVTFAVKAVPAANQPKSFYGAVGSGYTISAEADRTQVEAGEAVNLTVKVNGPGNIKPTSDLKLPQLPGFKVYDVVSNSGAVASNGTLKSYKIFKTVIVPVSSGSYTVPALSWSYFDPAAGQYRTIRTKPISIEVTPSSKTESGFDFGAHTDLGGGFRQLGQDIRYLKSDVGTPTDNLLLQVAGLSWLTYVFAACVLLCAVFALLDKKTLAGKRALAKARAQLKNAQNEQTIADALSLYLAVRYGVHTASLPLRNISAALKKRGCPDRLITRFETLWQRLDAARFAPVDLQAEGTQTLAAQAAELIKDMDKGGRL